MKRYKNYKSVTPVENPEEKAWCISLIEKKKRNQMKVRFADGKSSSYISQVIVNENDVAIIGNTFPYGFAKGLLPAGTTGKIGVITQIAPSVTLKYATAVTLDYVFTETTDKKKLVKLINECADYASLDENNYKTLPDHNATEQIHPITTLAKRLLASASILAFPNIATDEQIAAAKTYICTPQIIDKRASSLQRECPELVDIDLRDIHVFVDGKNDVELDAMNLKYMEDGYLDGWRPRPEEIEPQINEYVNKYSYIAAISIMVRGGFLNLLKAFLSANPPIKSFYDEIIGDVEIYGNEKAMQVLKENANNVI